jgi:hypothetical protein
MAIWSEMPWLGAAVKLFLIALFAPVWWPLLVEIRAEIARTADPSAAAAGGNAKSKTAKIPFLARLHGEPGGGRGVGQLARAGAFTGKARASSRGAQANRKESRPQATRRGFRGTR